MRSVSGVVARAALGAAMAGLIALGGSGGAVAQGMMMTADSPRAKGTYYRPARPAPRAKPALRAKRYYRSAVIAGSCGQFRYWSKGRCVDARTTPPKLK